MPFVLASAAGMSTTDTEAVRRANAQILIDSAATNTPVWLDGIYPIQRATEGPGITGSVVWLGSSPEVSGFVVHGAGSEIEVFHPALTAVTMRNIRIAANTETEVRQYRIFTTELEQTCGEIEINGCVFGNIALLNAFHSNDQGTTPRGFSSLRMTGSTVRNLVRVFFVNATSIPWTSVDLKDHQNIDCQMHTFFLQGSRPVLAGPVTAVNITSINRRGPKPALNTGTYYTPLFASDCEYVTWLNGYTEGYSTLRENSNCTSVFARGQRVIVKDDVIVNCVSVDRRNAFIDVKNGYIQGSHEAGQGELTRDLENITVICDEPYLASIIPDYSRATFWQCPWHLPDNVETREANRVTMKNISIRAPHLHSRYSWSSPGDLTVSNVTMDCELFTAQLTAGLFTLEAGPRMKRVQISDSNLLQRGETVTEYPLIAFRYPADGVDVIAFGNRLDGCLEANNYPPAVPTQPLVIEFIEIEGANVITQSDFPILRGASLDVDLAGSMPSSEGRTLRFVLQGMPGYDPVLTIQGEQESASITQSQTGALLQIGATITGTIPASDIGDKVYRYKVESVSNSDIDDVIRTHQGNVRVRA